MKLSHLLVICLLGLLMVFVYEKDQRTPPLTVAEQSGTWRTIAERLERRGNGNVSVAPMNDPQIMRIIFTGPLRVQMTPYDARKIAQGVWSELGASSFVRVADDTGHVFATASASGVE
jgi:hypothetical protein